MPLGVPLFPPLPLVIGGLGGLSLGGGGDEGDIGKGTFQLDVVGRLAADADEVRDGDPHSVLAAVENYICKGGFPFGDLG